MTDEQFLFDTFVSQQMLIMNATLTQIMENVIAYHEEHCEDKTPGCEFEFSKNFFEYMERLSMMLRNNATQPQGENLN